LEFKESWADSLRVSAIVTEEKRQDGVPKSDVKDVSGEPDVPVKTLAVEQLVEPEQIDTDELEQIDTDELETLRVDVEKDVEDVAVTEDVLDRELTEERDSEELIREKPVEPEGTLTKQELMDGWDFTDLAEGESDKDDEFDEFGFDIEDLPKEEVPDMPDAVTKEYEGWDELDIDGEDDVDLDEDEFKDDSEIDEGILDTRMKLMKMTAAEKLIMAKMGTKQERAILVRDSNKKVALAVVQSPKMSEFEIKMIAANRSVNEDVLREIYMHREWGRRPQIIKELVLNPKTPLSLTLRLIGKLSDFDLKEVSKSKEIPYGLMASAKRIHEQREQRRQRR
jgi:hypothetical protein